MDGRAYFIILWHENRVLAAKTGHRMKKPTTFFILWQENAQEDTGG